MHVLSLDVGSYSVKYLSSFIDRRKVVHGDMSEIIVRDYMTDHPELSVSEAQNSIIQDILDSNARPDTRIMYQSDTEMMTTRFLTLPVKSKKKAELMLPFQLEEDIPYALSEIHYSYKIEAQKSQNSALVELSRNTTFEPYYTALKEKNILPTILTTEASVLENYFNQNPMAGPFCILNLGHKTTRAFLFYNSRLLATHVSYVGGQEVNEMIAQSYKIDMDEAILYKHQNAFLLTENQLGEVEPAQKEFAASMDRVFAPLVADFSRWKVGFKVNFNLGIGNVYLCGGTANIKNISNYLTEKLNTKVALLETFDKVEAEKIDLSPKNKSKYAFVNMMAQGFRKKNRFINLLSGRFAQSSAAEIPLHSFAFLGVRVAAATAVLAISLVAERVFMERDILFVNARLTSIMKNDELDINPRIRRAINTTPAPVYDALVKKQRAVKQEISTLQSAIEIQALTPLVMVSQIGARTNVTMTAFSTNDANEINATFTSEDVNELSKMKELLERSQLVGVQTTLDQKKLVLTMTASGI